MTGYYKYKASGCSYAKTAEGTQAGAGRSPLQPSAKGTTVGQYLKFPRLWWRIDTGSVSRVSKER